MFFARPGEYEAAGMFSMGHFVLFVLTMIAVTILVLCTRNKKDKEVKKIIRIVTIIVWVLEIIKIIFNLKIGNTNPNNYIPLYFCSLILYAGILSSFCKGNLQRVGDVFLATGGLIAGTVFIACPTTSIQNYPVFHYISIQSFVLHGAMIYLGILLNITNYIELNAKDFWYYFGLIILISVIAYVYNIFNDSNLMFISKDFPGTVMHVLYQYTEGFLFTAIMVIIQATIPFYVVYGYDRLVSKLQKNS